MSQEHRWGPLFDVLRAQRTPIAAADLAAQLGTSESSVHRDIRGLRDLGAEILGGAGQGFMLVPAVYLPHQVLQDVEVEALIRALQASQAAEPPDLAEAAARVLSRIRGVLPGELRARVDGMDGERWPHAGVPTAR